MPVDLQKLHDMTVTAIALAEVTIEQTVGWIRILFGHLPDN
jgi:hypothetical protein